MNFKNLICPLAVAFLFAACTNNSATPTTNKTHKAWSDANENAFMQKCEEGAAGKMTSEKAKAYCSCMLDKIEAKYPVADSAASMTLNDMMTLAKDCAK